MARRYDLFRISDYRWIIEEDRTFYIDPTAQTTQHRGCRPRHRIVPTFGTNFHTSYMPLVATGCTGPLSCEGGQTLAWAAPRFAIWATAFAGPRHVNRRCRSRAGPSGPDQALLHFGPAGRCGELVRELGNCLSNPTPSCGHGMGGAPIAASAARHLHCYSSSRRHRV